MKTSLLAVSLIIFNVIFSSAQNPKLYGMTAYGGSNNEGIIFSYESGNATYTKFKDFKGGNGSYPFGSLIQASDGKLYGMTNDDSSNHWGVIFSFDPSTANYTKLYDFDFTNGANPYGSLMQASDGKLYGMTYYGGSNYAGVIFSFDPSTASYTKLHDFDGSDGAKPHGSLIQASNGKLYGMTAEGGSINGGVIFSFDPSSATYIKLREFDISTGTNPLGSLIEAANGKLYGMTSYGGANSGGVIFSFNPSNGTYTKLKDFDYTSGHFPYGSLIQASNGKLYGMTANGGTNDFGVIFSFDLSHATYSKLWDFDYTNGENPYGDLMQASDGKLYGMTWGGGSSNMGVAFSFDIAASTFTKLQDFTGTNGANANASFIEITCKPKTYYRDADGDGYGNAADSVQLCNPQAGYVTNNTDCNDRNASVHSGTIPPKPTISGSNTICPGGSDKLIASVATTYLWSTGATKKAINTTAAGNYTVTITKKSGCENTSDVFTVTALPCSSPAGLSVSNITSTSVVLHWNATNCAKKYKVQVKQGSSAWETFSNITTNSLALNDLTPNKIYKWRVQTICSFNPLTTSDFEAGPNFRTASSLESETVATTNAKANKVFDVSISPNPAQNIMHILIEGYSGKVSIQLNSLEGRKLQELKVLSTGVKITEPEMDISKYSNGMYFITVIDEQGNRKTEKLIISR